MSLFSRKSPATIDVPHQHAAIGQFWAWWQDLGAADTDAAIEQHAAQHMVEAISQRVREIAPGLAWELGPGNSLPGGHSRHVLTVTAEGNPELRAAAHRWLAAAPPADAVWDYAAARPPRLDATSAVLNFGGATIDAASVAVVAMVRGAAVDVTLHAPALAALPVQPRMGAAFVLLDHLLGEAAVETWVGAINVATQPLPSSEPLASLPAVVEEVRAARGRPASHRERGVVDGECRVSAAHDPAWSAVASLQR